MPTTDSPPPTEAPLATLRTPCTDATPVTARRASVASCATVRSPQAVTLLPLISPTALRLHPTETLAPNAAVPLTSRSASVVLWATVRLLATRSDTVAASMWAVEATTSLAPIETAVRMGASMLSA